MMIDGAGWHQSAALGLPHNLRLLALPAYLPEQSSVQHLSDDIR
ncbi:MAG: hypothetical protein WAN46_18865 [Gammaproteobacteria bacterium]